MNSIIIIGNKGYKHIEVNDIIDIFTNNIRLNMSTNHNNNGTKIDYHMLNVHIYNNFIENKKSLKECLDFYSEKKNMITCHHLETFYYYIKNNKDSLKIIKQTNVNYNNFINSLGCNIYLNDNINIPSCGFNAILEVLKNNKKPFIFGFGLQISDRLSYYYIDNDLNNNQITRSPCHNEDNEISLLKWLHNNNFIDATMCMLEDNYLPTFSCNIIKPKPEIILLFLNKYGIVILKNYYSEENLNTIISEYNRLLHERKNDLLYTKGDDGENGEPRLFNVEKHSDYILKYFSNNQLFNNIASRYINNNLRNKKTMINKVIYREGEKSNSGGGWHRDSHDIQFKTIMYLSDVTEENGNFQFITNSSKKYIGYPTPRTKDYNTRYSDDTIDELLKNNNKCKIHDIIGDKGTIIIVDTTNIHRGKDILKGERYAITEYYI